MKSFKVAVILPVYNADKTIVRALQSVLKQSYQNFILYIINDCSNDGTENILSTYTSHPRIKLITHMTNKGVAEARNSGVLNSKEELICFIDSDDEWDCRKLEQQVEAIRLGYEVVFSSYNYIKNSKERTVFYGKREITIKDFIKKKFRVCFSTVMVKRKEIEILFEKMGHEDFLYLYQYMSTSKVAYIVSEKLCNHYIQNDSLSSRKGKAAIWHYKILKKIYPNSFFKQIYLFLNYMFQAVKFNRHR